MKDLIIDFETLGTEPSNCVVIDCSVMVFDWDRFTSSNPYTIKDVKEAKKFKLSVSDQAKNYGYKVDQGVLEFWQQQSKEVRNNIKPRSDDITVEEFIKQFHDFVIDSNIKHWWSRSNTFDPVILTRLYDSQGKKQHMFEYLKFWLVRDTRTYIDAKFDFKQKKNAFCPVSDDQAWEQKFKLHDSAWDVLADVLRLQAIARAENDLPLI